MFVEEKKIKQINGLIQTRSYGKLIKEAHPVREMHPVLCEGLYNICTQNSSIIPQWIQKDLFNTLKGNGTFKYYYFKLYRNTKIPYNLRFLFFKNDMCKEEPNNIKKLELKDFKFYAYAITMLDHDTNGFYFIVHYKDAIKFMQMIRNANQETAYEKRSREAELENLMDVCDGNEIKHSYEYNKIFEELDEYERKLLFIKMKEAGLDKKTRKLLKEINNTHVKSFEVMIENKEARLDTLKELIEEYEEAPKEKPTTDPLTYFSWKEEAEELETELIRLQEEDNTWTYFKTTLKDYEW